MARFDHGGDPARGGGRSVRLDFSVNLNPLGMPPEAAAAAAAACAGVAYPDPRCRRLREGIARRDGVAADQVICGGGGAELIYRLAHTLRPRRALVLAPTFSEYAAALESAGCRVERFRLSSRQDYDPGPDLAERVVPGLDAVFLCTPNNPTGRLLPGTVIEAVAERCAQWDVRLVVDECFLDLSDEAGPGLAPLLARWPRLFLLRAFTKSYALAGLRLGYGLSGDRQLLADMVRCGPPWSVSAPAQAAGLAALERPDWPALAREVIRVQRPYLAAGLKELGAQVVPGQANFLLFRLPGVTDLEQQMLEQGILIRSCGNDTALTREHYRVCVRREEENRQLLRALANALDGRG